MSDFVPPRIYLHKATGRARVRVNGRDIYLGKYGTTEAAERYARLIAEMAAGRPPVPKQEGPRTVGQIVALWASWMQQSYAPDSSEHRGSRLSLAPVLALYGSTAAADFDPPALAAIQATMARSGLARGTVNRRVMRVRTVWRWAEARKLVPAGSWAALLTLPGLRRNDPSVKHLPARKAADWEDVKKVIRQLPPVHKAMVLVMWWSGMRSCEVRKMRVGEVERGALVWLYRPVEHKTAHLGQDRVIALGRKCQSVLAKWLPGRGPEEVVFAGRRGRPRLADSFAGALRQAGRQAGVKVTPYQCRHAFKLRVTRAYGLDAARAALGQTSLGATNQYAAGQDAQAAEAVARKAG